MTAQILDMRHSLCLTSAPLAVEELVPAALADYELQRHSPGSLKCTCMLARFMHQVLTHALLGHTPALQMYQKQGPYVPGCITQMVNGNARRTTALTLIHHMPEQAASAAAVKMPYSLREAGQLDYAHRVRPLS